MCVLYCVGNCMRDPFYSCEKMYVCSGMQGTEMLGANRPDKLALNIFVLYLGTSASAVRPLLHHRRQEELPKLQLRLSQL